MSTSLTVSISSLNEHDDMPVQPNMYATLNFLSSAALKLSQADLVKYVSLQMI
jgi:hypothetical protein